MKYDRIVVDNIDNSIDKLYNKLLNKKLSFYIVEYNNSYYILTKEKSFFKVKDIKEFIDNFNKDTYYKTIINSNKSYYDRDLKIYYDYLDKYKNKMNQKYNNKYLFGSIAVRTANNAFITTIRGKTNLDDFCVVNKVDNENNIVYVSDKKATLNAPLLYNIFKNKSVKIIVHINHEYNDTLPYYDYKFPGTKEDSLRNIQTSFNIKHHGLFLLFDEQGIII